MGVFLLSLGFGPASQNCRLGQPAKIDLGHKVLFLRPTPAGLIALPFGTAQV